MTYMSDNEEATKTTTETEEIVGKAPHVADYNRLVEEAIALGMKGYRPLASRFRDSATGAARVAALESSIKAFKQGLAAEERQPGPEVQPQEEADMAKTTTARKTKTAGKVKGKAAAKPAKKAASQNARTRVAAKDKPVRDGIAGVFGSREDSNQEKALLKLDAAKGKPVPLGDLLQAIYKSKDSEEFRGAFNAVVAGIKKAIETKKLGYVFEMEGRGDEAAFSLKKK
jgi:hypothetical protein